MQRKLKDFVGPWKAGEKMYLTYKLMKYDRKMFVTKKLKNNFIGHRLLKLSGYEKSKRYAALERKNFIVTMIIATFFIAAAAVIYYERKLAQISGNADAIASWGLVAKTVDTLYTVNIFVLFAVGIITLICMISASVKGEYDKSHRYAFPSKDAILLSICLLLTEIIFLQ